MPLKLEFNSIILIWKGLLSSDRVNWLEESKPNSNRDRFDTEYPYTIFKSSLQKFRNPIKRCCRACVICPLLETRCFAESTTLKHKFPISQPHPKQFFNCKTKNVIYLIICTTPGCGTQYVGYTTRPLIRRITEHLSDGPMIKHIKEANYKYKK